MLVDPVYDTENEGSKIVELQIDVKKGRCLYLLLTSTNGNTIGGPLAAFVLSCILIFEMSYKTSVLPLSQALAYLEKEKNYATINLFGEVYE